MQVSISGIHVDTGDAFRTHVYQALATLNDRYQIQPIEATVNLTKEGYEFRSDVSAHLGRGVIMRGQGFAKDAHDSFDDAISTIVKRLKRHKKRLSDHHKGRHLSHKFAKAPYYVLNPHENEDAVSSHASPVIAELEAEIPTLTVSEAVLRLDLSQEPAMLFHNQSHGGLNMVYQRSDGNIGWVDPKNEKN